MQSPFPTEFFFASESSAKDEVEGICKSNVQKGCKTLPFFILHITKKQNHKSSIHSSFRIMQYACQIYN